MIQRIPHDDIREEVPWFVRHSYFSVIIFAAIVHITWGIALLVDERAAWATAIHAIYALFGNAHEVAWILIVAGLLAPLGIRLVEKGYPSTGLVIILPQQMALIVSLIKAIECVVASQFADGVIRPRAFIFADQFPGILITLWHTAMILWYHGAFSILYRKP